MTDLRLADVVLMKESTALDDDVHRPGKRRQCSLKIQHGDDFKLESVASIGKINSKEAAFEDLTDVERLG